MRISYVIPAHNEEPVLRKTAEAVVARLQSHPPSELILVENGSTDGTPALVEALPSELSSPEVAVRAASSERGPGRALREGMRLATGELVVLTGADLPFGFSDLDAFLAMRDRPRLAIGSKTHPASRVGSGTHRRLMSWGFRILRRAVLGLGGGDTQGTILMEGALAREILDDLGRDDYLITTEIVARAAAAGVATVEVPVDYLDPRGDSKVRPVRDAAGMAVGLVALRRSLRSRARS